MYKFNNDNIITGYIKQLLHSFNLPKCKVFKTVEDFKEYYNNIPADIVGVFGIVKKYRQDRDYILYLTKSEKINADKVQSIYNISEVSVYNYNQKYLNLTTNLSLFNNIYDSNCHKYLGDYLRFIRDYLNINLMSMYNCFSNELLIGSKYKYILIPVKHNTKYTLAFTGSKYKYLFTYKNTLEDIEDLFKNKDNLNNIQTVTSSFNKPLLLQSGRGQYSKPSQTNPVYTLFNESNYKLVIRVPKTYDKPITVLEGDYTNRKNVFVPIQANYEGNSYNSVDVDRLLNNFELLNYRIESKKVSYPFADRLIEYLTDMVISPIDNISNNIIDAKYKALLRYTDKSQIQKVNVNADFNNIDRLRFLEVMSKTKFKFKNTYDLLGYVDKEIEYCLDDESRNPKEV